MDMLPQPRPSRHPEGSPIDLRRLRYFMAVCDHGGISRAASSLGMTQPALTRQIQILEREVGLPLFTRSGRGTEPSEQGRHLLAVAQDQIRILDEAVRGLRLRFGAPAAQVRIGVCPSIAPLFVDELAADLRERQPTLVLSVVKAYSGDIQKLLDQQQLDLALTYSTGSVGAADRIDLLSERLVLVSGRAGAPARRHRHTLSQVAALPLILPSRMHELRRIIDQVSAAGGVALVPAMELDSLEAVRAMLVEPGSRYCTILPRNSADLGLGAESLVLGEIDHPGMKRTVALVQPSHARPDPAVGLVAQRVAARAAALRDQLPTVF